jgi:hypothetical protein
MGIIMIRLTCTKTKRMAEFDDTSVQCFKVTDKHQLPQSVFPRVETSKALQQAIAWVNHGDLSLLT